MDKIVGEKIEGQATEIRFTKTVAAPQQTESHTILELCRDCQNTKNLLKAQQTILEEAWSKMTKEEKAEWLKEYEKSI